MYQHTIVALFFYGDIMSIAERAERLAANLLADRERHTPSRHNIVPCFSCGHTFVYQGRRDDFPRLLCCRD
jgi:hypothetical protein